MLVLSQTVVIKKIYMNNVLIIAHPRSGSTNLMISIAKANDLKGCFEPFGGRKRRMLISNSCTKVIISRKDLDTYIDLSKKFDKTILLARRNIVAASESFVKLNMSELKNPTMKWSSLTDREKQFVPMAVEKITNQQHELNKLSEILNIDIDYYEDVYTSKTLNDKSIKLDLKYLDPKLKCKVKKLEVI